jgi:hypothetical protein
MNSRRIQKTSEKKTIQYVNEKFNKEILLQKKESNRNLGNKRLNMSNQKTCGKLH